MLVVELVSIYTSVYEMMTHRYTSYADYPHRPPSTESA